MHLPSSTSDLEYHIIYTYIIYDIIYSMTHYLPSSTSDLEKEELTAQTWDYYIKVLYQALIGSRVGFGAKNQTNTMTMWSKYMYTCFMHYYLVKNKLASSIAISEIWNYHWLTHWTFCVVLIELTQLSICSCRPEFQSLYVLVLPKIPRHVSTALDSSN